MSTEALAWAWQQQPKTSTQKLVLAALADRADEEGFCFPSMKWLARKCQPLKPETARKALADLVGQGLIVKVERRRRADGSLGTWLLQLPISQREQDASGESSHREPSAGRPAVAGSRSDSAISDSTISEVAKAPSLEALAVFEVWCTQKNLIQHRRSYLNEKMRRLIERRVKQYGLNDVYAAIRSYSAVLASPLHYWNHRWTLGDFLTRGLDKFVPEAQPEQVFRTKRTRGMNPQDIREAGRLIDDYRSPRPFTSTQDILALSASNDYNPHQDDTVDGDPSGHARRADGSLPESNGRAGHDAPLHRGAL